MQKTMEITRDVILDLLPGYFGDEASADTKQLVEGWFAEDLEFAAIAKRLSESRNKESKPDAEKKSLERTRMLIRSRNTMLGFSICCSLAPFFVMFGNGGVRWFMPRDNPLQSLALGVCALGCWIAWYILRRKTCSSGV